MLQLQVSRLALPAATGVPAGAGSPAGSGHGQAARPLAGRQVVRPETLVLVGVRACQIRGTHHAKQGQRDVVPSAVCAVYFVLVLGPPPAWPGRRCARTKWASQASGAAGER